MYLRIAGECSRQHLDGDVAIQLGIRGSIDGAHAGFAELGCGPVVGGGVMSAGLLAWYHFRARVDPGMPQRREEQAASQRLDSRKTPVDLYVIDHVERLPSEN